MNHEEPHPEALETATPEELTDPLSVAEWERAIVPAITIGQITVADRVLAIAHCELWATWRSQLAEAGKLKHVVVAGPNDYPMPNHARVMANRTLMMLAKVDAELGFTPTSRTRVHVKPKAKPAISIADQQKALYR